jgi:threonine dehydrogenase-like Zn-dependent dehydrogenase
LKGAQRSVTIQKPANEIHHAWRAEGSLPQVMGHFAEVTELSPDRHRWKVRGPPGTSLEWESHIVEEHFGELLRWEASTHAFGGYAGAHAQYVRVPHADTDCFLVPEGLADEQVLFLSDAVPTGYMGAELCGIQRGDTVAVWGCGGVGLMAMKSALLLGAARVIGIDRIPRRLRLAREEVGAQTVNSEEVDSVLDVLSELTGGRGPDACIEAVGMEAHGQGLEGAYDRANQALRLDTGRGEALREALHACRKGGTLVMLGIYLELDRFPLGAVITKGLALRAALQHGQKYLPRLLEHGVRGELDPSFLATHRFPLEDAVKGYELFKKKLDGCVRAVFLPN